MTKSAKLTTQKSAHQATTVYKKFIITLSARSMLKKRSRQRIPNQRELDDCLRYGLVTGLNKAGPYSRGLECTAVKGPKIPFCIASPSEGISRRTSSPGF